MKASQLPIFTAKEIPKDAVVKSHQLLIKAGYIRKQASGLYVYLPFGLIVHQKIEQIIREEMNHFGGVEVKLPILTPSELWKESGRWDIMGSELMKLTDRHQVDFAVAPTHEEAMVQLASTFLQSYKQLPINLYQIGQKYRDEIRPRYGLIRCREFVMKDAYSFHNDNESLDETYQKMRECYRSIFKRCSLETVSVEADSGNMGGAGSEEFMVPSEIGEETLLLCKDASCGYKSNQEKTEYIPKKKNEDSATDATLEEIFTPNKRTIEEVAEFLNTTPEKFIKSIILENKTHIVLAFIPGDRELSEIKLENHLNLKELVPAEAESICKVTGADPGFAGPVNLPVQNEDEVTYEIYQNNESVKVTKKVVVVIDRNIKNSGGWITGANKNDTHLKNICEGRDFTNTSLNVDLILAEENDLCPVCKKEKLMVKKGIEVGHIFKLGKKYTESMKLSVLNKEGKPFFPTMGCYGIGVGRTLATCIEQNHDENGLLWPKNLSPFEYYLVGIFKKDEEKKTVDDLYKTLIEKGLSVYYDDRKERPGVKFKDAELVGFPTIIVAGKNFVQNQTLEIKDRKTLEKKEIQLNEFLEEI